MKRVVVTGMGLVTPLGTGIEENWKNLLAGKTAIRRHNRDGQPDYLGYFGKVNGMDRLENVPSKLSSQVRFLNRGSLLGFEAARQAIENAAIDLLAIPRERRSLFVSSGDLTNVGYEFMYPALKDGTRGMNKGVNFSILNKSTMNKVNPFFLLESIYNNLFSFLSAAYEFMGPNTSLASLSPCGGHAMELACAKIRAGQADIALAVGCGNWIEEIPMYEMEGLGILSRCKKGPNSFRPFDRGRDGFIPGEGGAALLVEDRDKALQRGAQILGEIRGLGNCIEFPSGKGMSVPELISANAIEAALHEASREAGDLAFILPHGSGTRKGDLSELRSIATVLAEKRSDVPVCGLKPYTGHMAAASDVCEVIFGIRAASEGIVPATLNFSKTDSDFADLRISASAQKISGKSFVSVSYGILGQTSCVLVEGRG